MRLGYVQAEGVGGIEHVFGKLLRQLGPARADLGEALPGSTLEQGTRQLEFLQGQVQRVAARRGQRGVLFAHLAVALQQALVRRQPGVKGGDGAQAAAVGSPNLRGVRHGMQVPHQAPGAVQPLGGHVQHRRQGVERWSDLGAHCALKRLVRLTQQGVDRRLDVLGPDAVEGRCVPEVQQGIGCRRQVGVHGAE